MKKKHYCQQSAFFETNVLSQLQKCAVPPDHLGSEISFSRNCNIPKHCENIKTERTYLNHVCTLFVQYFDRFYTYSNNSQGL